MKPTSRRPLENWRAEQRPSLFVRSQNTAEKGMTIEDQTSEASRVELPAQSVSDYAIYMLDPNGFVSSWNAGARRLEGYEAEEIIGQHLSCFYTLEEREKEIPRKKIFEIPVKAQLRIFCILRHGHQSLSAVLTQNSCEAIPFQKSLTFFLSLMARGE